MSALENIAWEQEHEWAARLAPGAARVSAEIDAERRAACYFHGALIHEATRCLYIEFEGEQKELEATVRFVVEPYEPRTRDTPARDACAEILSVQVGGMDIQTLLGKEIENALADDLMRGSEL